MFGKKEKSERKLNPIKEKEGLEQTQEQKLKPIDKSGQWFDAVHLHYNEDSMFLEKRVLTEYCKRHPDAVPAFSSTLPFGNHAHWFKRTGPGTEFFEEERWLVSNLHET